MERVDLNVPVYTEPRNDLRLWRNGGPWDPATTTVIVGVLPMSGRWYARWLGRGPLRPGACVYSGARAARLAGDTARRWMRTVGGSWTGG